MGKIGNLNRRIEIKRPVTTKSPLGAPVKTYQHVCYGWASRQEVAESPEQYINNRLVVAKRWNYKMHHNDEIDETMLLIDAGLEYNIPSINRDDAILMTLTVEKIIE